MNRSQSSAGSLSPSRSPNHTLNRASSPAMRASLQSPLQALALEQAVATELMLSMDSKRYDTHAPRGGKADGGEPQTLLGNSSASCSP